MLNAFGLFARKLRLDRAHLLKDMANLLNVSPAFLSAVECGKKNVPAGWAEALTKSYTLEQKQAEALRSAIDESQRSVSMDLSEASPERRSVAVAFARQFDRLSDGQIAQLKRAMLTSATKTGTGDK